MDFSLNDEQVTLRDMVREFARQEIAPGAAERDRLGEFPHEVLAKAGELGLCGMVVPEEWGGSGLDPVAYCVAIEEIARECPSTAVTLAVTNSVCGQPILRFGTDEQKERFLRPLAEGRILGGFMLTEPGSGSDAKAMTTRAERRGDRFVLNGTKAWVTNAVVGKVFVVMARTGEAPGDVTAFLVPSDAKGLEVARLEDKMGLRASKTAMYAFTDVEIPEELVLGGVGNGMKVALGSLDRGRLGIGAQALGMAMASMGEAARYARERKAFGKPIGELQAIQWMLADMHAKTEAARLLLWRAAAASAAGRLPSHWSAMAKLYCTEAASFVCDRAVQVFGGNGYSREYKVERMYRDVRVTTIYEGTSQVQQLVVARALLAG